MKLKEMRIAKNKTQAQTARETGISPTCLNRYERGKRKLPIETAKKIATVLDCEWTKLYEP